MTFPFEQMSSRSMGRYFWTRCAHVVRSALTGRFLTSLAAQRLENFVGIEIRRRYWWRLAQLMAKEVRTGNLRIIWADAKAVSRVIFGDSVLDNVYVTFPDPWWKKRHAKRRLVDTRFGSELAGLLKQGILWVKLDVQPLADEIREALAAQDGFSAPELLIGMTCRSPIAKPTAFGMDYPSGDLL